MQDDFEADASSSHLHILVLGKHGSWVSELIWVTEDGAINKERRSENVPGLDNVGCELCGIVDALKSADGKSSSATVYVVNESSYKTWNERLEHWAVNGWKKSDGDLPKHLHLWKQIWSASKELSIDWRKVKSEEFEEFQMYDVLVEEAMDADAGPLLQRALDRDPY